MNFIVGKLMSSIGSMSSFRSSMWTSLDKVLQRMAVVINQSFQLFGILTKKRDSWTQQNFINFLGDDGGELDDQSDSFCTSFVSALMEDVSKQYRASASDNVLLLSVFL